MSLINKNLMMLTNYLTKRRYEKIKKIFIQHDIHPKNEKIYL